MTIRGRWLILLFALVVCLSTSSAMAGGDVNVIFGHKSLSEEKFADLGIDGQPMLGVTLTLDFQGPIALAIDVLSSQADTTETTAAAFPVTTRTEVETLELDLGVRKLWGIKRWRPYVGGGLSIIQLEAKQTTSTDILGNIVEDVLIDDDDTGVGFWLASGALWTLPKGLNVGAEVRYSDAEGELTSEGFTSKQTFDAGGVGLGVMLGYHW